MCTTRMPAASRRQLLHRAHKRTRQGTRNQSTTRIRRRLPIRAQALGCQGSPRKRVLLALQTATRIRCAIPPRTRRRRPQHHPWTRVPTLQPQRSRPSITPLRLTLEPRAHSLLTLAQIPAGKITRIVYGIPDFPSSRRGAGGPHRSPECHRAAGEGSG